MGILASTRRHPSNHRRSPQEIVVDEQQEVFVSWPLLVVALVVKVVGFVLCPDFRCSGESEYEKGDSAVILERSSKLPFINPRPKVPALGADFGVIERMDDLTLLFGDRANTHAPPSAKAIVTLVVMITFLLWPILLGLT